MTPTENYLRRDEAEHRDILDTIREMSATQSKTLDEIKSIRGDFARILAETRKEAEEREERHREDVKALNARISTTESIIVAAKDERNKQVREIEKAIDTRMPTGERAWAVLKWGGGIAGLLLLGAIIKQVLVTS